MADPTMSAGASAADPSAQGADQSQGGADQSYTICIMVSGDGKFGVGVEQGDGSDDSSGSDDGGSASDGSQDTPMAQVGSFKEALSMALDIYKSGGAPQSSGDDDFNAGFGQNQDASGMGGAQQ